MSQRNVCYIVFSSRHRAQIDFTAPRRYIFTVGSKRSRCAEYCSIQPQRRRLFVITKRKVMCGWSCMDVS